MSGGRSVEAADWRDRVIDDGADRDSWIAARSFRIGASDAAKFAKIESADKYADAKLKPRSFFGNEKTENGHTWEDGLTMECGVPPSKALIGAPGNDGFAATPDGLLELPDGSLRLAEAKVKHNKIVTGPSVGEWRQLAWQFVCLPEAVETYFIWAEVVQNERGDWVLRRDGVKRLLVPFDHPKIIAARELIVPIAHQVLERLQAAHEFERSLE